MKKKIRKYIVGIPYGSHTRLSTKDKFLVYFYADSYSWDTAGNTYYCHPTKLDVEWKWHRYSSKEGKTAFNEAMYDIWKEFPTQKEALAYIYKLTKIKPWLLDNTHLEEYKKLENNSRTKLAIKQLYPELFL